MDDRATNREYLVTLLGYGGHRLLEASDGQEGLAVAQAERPDLILTGIAMPAMDGYEFTRQVPSDRPYRRAWPETKVGAYIRDQAGQHFDPAVVAA